MRTTYTVITRTQSSRWSSVYTTSSSCCAYLRAIGERMRGRSVAVQVSITDTSEEN